MSNKTLIQYFEWYLPVTGRHWQRVARDAAHLAWLGITDVWLPPAYKGHAGMMDVGYGVYDLFDLGEFYQKGTISTKYGTKEEYLAAINALHAQGVGVIGDIVLNHRMGEDYREDVYATKVEHLNRFKQIVNRKLISAGTGFIFPGRNGKYSNFRWNKNHFTSVDINAYTDKAGIFLFESCDWSDEVDDENGNYDYLMGANVKFTNPDVVNELCHWGRWYLDTAKLDGFRLDAVKHIPHSFFKNWLAHVRGHAGQDLFAVGEYWNPDLEKLNKYLEKVEGSMSLFDVPLHSHFHEISNLEQGSEQLNNYDLRTVFDNTLVACDAEHAVTFVDNHDTQDDQPLYSWVHEWFKQHAYALILLRDKGTPCVFYGDMYGSYHTGKPVVPGLEEMLLARRRYAIGEQTDYFDDKHVIGWTRQGGLAVLMSINGAASKYMKIGYPHEKFVDLLGNCRDKVQINEHGWGEFKVNERSVSVWIPEKLYEKFEKPDIRRYEELTQGLD